MHCHPYVPFFALLAVVTLSRCVPGDLSKPPVVLVHGFGASAYHWRYVVPELAKKYSVYAVDLLGFGLSEKPSVVYNGYSIWSEQLRDFTREVSLKLWPSLHAIQPFSCQLLPVILKRSITSTAWMECCVCNSSFLL